jgi:hypothetical protein
MFLKLVARGSNITCRRPVDVWHSLHVSSNKPVRALLTWVPPHEGRPFVTILSLSLVCQFGTWLLRSCDSRAKLPYAE